MRKSTNDGHDKQRTGGAGSTYKTTHYDRDGRKTGESRETTGGFGFKRMEHFDRNGHKIGETRLKNDD